MQSLIGKKSKMHAKTTKFTIGNRSGFTLVELMVTVFLTAIAVIAIYRGYTSFSQSADAQQQVMEMQQNLRIGMYNLEKDIIRAGMNEENDNVVLIGTTRVDADAASFPTADAATVEVGMDLTGADDGETNGLDDDGDGTIDEAGEGDGNDNDDDGSTDEDDEVRIGDGDYNDLGERIRYSLSAAGTTFDLQKEVWDGAGAYGAAQKIITNVDALHFTYIKEDGVTALTTLPLSETDRAQIDTVEITMVVRATNEDFRITNNETYSNQLGTWTWTPSPPDNFRRRAMSMRIKIRNANL